MIVELKIKDGMSEKVINILQDLKDVLFDKIDIKDKEYIQKQQELYTMFKQCKNTSSKAKNTQ